MVKDTLQETKDVVWPTIQKYLTDPDYPRQFSVPKEFDSESKNFWNINKVYPERMGKYLRPTLVLLTANAFGKETDDNLVKTAAAMQLSEEWVLIHDDIQDKSEERRGKPALHKIYGQELAINAGDALHIIMWKLVNDVDSKEISNEFYRMLLRTTLGQGVEQGWTNSKSEIDEQKYFFMADSKSAYYSIAGPMRLGAILAGADKKQLDSITEFGLHLGRCFQIIDDIIDLEQDKIEGKQTLATKNGIESARKLAGEEKKLAKSIFDNDLVFLKDEPARTKIVEIIEFILERDY